MEEAKKPRERQTKGKKGENERARYGREQGERERATIGAGGEVKGRRV